MAVLVTDDVSLLSCQVRKALSAAAHLCLSPSLPRSACQRHHLDLSHTGSFAARLSSKVLELFSPCFRHELIVVVGWQGEAHPLAYDSSDKMRVPAWTDRIFYRGSELTRTTAQVPLGHPRHCLDLHNSFSQSAIAGRIEYAVGVPLERDATWLQKLPFLCLVHICSRFKDGAIWSQLGFLQGMLWRIENQGRM